MDKKKLATILICVAVVVLVLILLFTQGDDNPPQTYDELVQEQIKLIKKTKLETNEDRLYLLTTLGWEVEIQPEAYSEVQIPEEFSEVYENYNKIQKTMGLDLSKYKGEKVMRYTYKVMNHPSGEKDVRATLLVYKNKLIGGDICTVRLDGFMQNLLMPRDDDDVSAETTGGQQTTTATEAGLIQTGEFTEEPDENSAVYPTE
jgi:hypothetical protein